LLTNSGGYGLLAKVGDLVARQRGGKAFLTLESGEQPLPPALASAGGLDDQVACLSANGRLLVFPLSDLKLQPNGGRGLTLMDLEPPDSLASVAVFSQALRIEGIGRGGKARDELLKGASLAVYLSKRARKGKPQDAIPKALRVAAG
jgi:topoisomerase-4 subunit A